MISTVLFDLDDLLSDTESLHCRAYQAVLHQHGLELSDAQYHDHWIRQGLGVADYLRNQGLSLDPARLRKAKGAEYKRLVESCCQPMPGALDLLKRLRGRKTLGLASSAYSDAVEAVLTKLDIAGFFSCIVSGDQVQRLKPFPDIFLEAARRLGVSPERCVVIEDAEAGVEAGNTAGMYTVGLGPLERVGKATAVFPTLEGVTLDAIMHCLIPTTSGD
jgi:kojibiose phosphorylase